MSPELIDPKRFGSETSHPTKPSDCYALGMVIYEAITGHFPFHRDPDLIVFLKVLDGKCPSREAGFADGLWEMLKLCWESRPSARPSVEDVLQCLKMVSDPSERSSIGTDEETEDGDNWDSTDDSFCASPTPLLLSKVSWFLSCSFRVVRCNHGGRFPYSGASRGSLTT